MGKARLFRGRASYKTSDVIALFLLGLFLGAISFLILVLVEWVYRHLGGGG